jgi:thymidylate synthase ThyX
LIFIRHITIIVFESEGEFMEYSNDDIKILKYFFSNIDQPIFVAKNIDPKIWALMQAKYSRSTESLRDSFLKVIKEDDGTYNAYLDMVEKATSDVENNYAIDKAKSFLDKWVVGWGHSSVAEGAIIGICLEGVSILATKVIEDSRLCSFIEKSTRYVSFTRDSFYLDPDLMSSEFANEIKELIDLLFSTYEKLHDPVLDYVKSVVPQGKMGDLGYNTKCAARRFDAIRYLLPTCTKTFMGWTVNARQLAHSISKLESHSLKEMKEIGQNVKSEASQILSPLLNVAGEKDYFVETEKNMDGLAKMVDINDTHIKPVNLLYCTDDAENKLIASILYRYKNVSYVSVIDKVKSMSELEKKAVFDEYMSLAGKIAPLRELEHVDFTFEILMDYGAFRDLQRHRMTTQTNPIFTTDLGYDVPPDIINSGVEKEYRFAMDSAKKLFDKIRDKYPVQAQYIIPLGYRKRYMVKMNLRELHYFIKLRSTPAGHIAYRYITYNIYKSVKENYPLLAKYLIVNCDDSDFEEYETKLLESMNYN